jgi:uncharacterized repeat protein (TIGR03803 family)
MYSFTTSDGSPASRLTLGPNGAVYGVTRDGGPAGAGTVYMVQSASNNGVYSKTTLYAFGGGADGSMPLSPPLVDSYGAIYGTTATGGASGFGTVYKLAPASNSTVWQKLTLYAFRGSSNGDGVAPASPLIFGPGGALFGASPSSTSADKGAVFKIQ